MNAKESLHQLTASLETWKKFTLDVSSGHGSNHVTKFWDASPEYDVARQILIAASGTIVHQVTKFSIVCGENAKPEEVVSICDACRDPCEKLHDALIVCVHTGTGPALTSLIAVSVRAIFISLLEVVGAATSGTSAALPSLTGRVWEACDEIQKIPASNKVAVKRVMMQSTIVAKDVIRELEESAEPVADDGFFGDNDEDEDYELTPADKQLLQASLTWLKASLDIMKAGIQLLSNVALVTEEDFQWADALTNVYTDVNSELSENGLNFCPPILESIQNQRILSLVNGQPVRPAFFRKLAAQYETAAQELQMLL